MRGEAWVALTATPSWRRLPTGISLPRLVTGPLSLTSARRRKSAASAIFSVKRSSCAPPICRFEKESSPVRTVIIRTERRIQRSSFRRLLMKTVTPVTRRGADLFFGNTPRCWRIAPLVMSRTGRLTIACSELLIPGSALNVTPRHNIRPRPGALPRGFSLIVVAPTVIAKSMDRITRPGAVLCDREVRR
jgi:hypothetical protein